MHFRLDLNTTDNPVLIEQIMRAVDAVKRPAVKQISDFDFKVVLICNRCYSHGGRLHPIDGEKVEPFRTALIEEFTEMSYTLSRHCDAHLLPLIENLAGCQAVCIVQHGEQLTIRGSSYDFAFDEIWGEHVQMASSYDRSEKGLERFDGTGSSNRAAA